MRLSLTAALHRQKKVGPPHDERIKGSAYYHFTYQKLTPHPILSSISARYGAVRDWTPPPTSSRHPPRTLAPRHRDQASRWIPRYLYRRSNFRKACAKYFGLGLNPAPSQLYPETRTAAQR